MSQFTEAQLRELGYVKDAFGWHKPLKRNEDHPPRLCADDTKPTQGNALERPVSGEGQSGTSPVRRTRIRFEIYAVRPCDWDGYSVKELQDMLVHAQILPSDKWDVVQGEVISHKAHSKAEERTEVTIDPPIPES